MATRYHRTGLEWNLTTDKALDLHDKIPAGNYVLKVTEKGVIYLAETQAFSLPDKIYGNVVERSSRILNTYYDRAQRGVSTGVLLEGDKGSGKTLLAKKLSMDACGKGVPTIMVNRPMVGDGFNMFIQSIEQPAIIMFDEFEKVYERSAQERDDDSAGAQGDLLTLLDGVFTSPKLFVLTANDPWKIDKRMQNRPGRIFYAFKYKGLSREMAMEYAEDRLKNKEHIGEVQTLTCMFDSLNFDMLQAIVEECNRYDETPLTAVKMLNIKPEISVRKPYMASLIVDGKKVKVYRDRDYGENGDIEREDGIVNVNVSAPFHVVYSEKEIGGMAANKYARFSPKHMTNVDIPEGKYTFVSGRNKLELVAEEDDIADWQRHMAF